MEEGNALLQIIGLLITVHVCARGIDMMLAADSRYSSAAGFARVVGALAFLAGAGLGLLLLVSPSPQFPSP